MFGREVLPTQRSASCGEVRATALNPVWHPIRMRVRQLGARAAAWAARSRSSRAAAPARSRPRLRAHVWMDMPSGPQLAALHEAVDPDAVHLSIGAASCPEDTEVCVLDPNLLPDDLQGLASLPALRALILPYGNTKQNSPLPK